MSDHPKSIQDALDSMTNAERRPYQRRSLLALLADLERREVITTDTTERDQCCGIDRDDDGFCIYRPYHPIYVELS